MASKRNLRRKACDGKTRYLTAQEAHKAAKSARRWTGDWIIPYGCQFCGGHHIGHPPAKVRQAIRAKVVYA
jgi:hypothetical protein